MDEETLNESFTCDQLQDLYFNIPTSPSMQDSFDSGRILPFKQKDRERLVNVISNNLRKPVESTISSPFQTPRISLKEKGVPQSKSKKPQKSLRTRYSELKAKYITSEVEKQRLKISLEKYLQTPCENCDLLKNDLTVTKEALGQAVELSKMLIREIRNTAQQVI